MVGAIGISGPSNRMTLESVPELAAVVMRVAQDLSDHLSFERR
jgi:DNA-binding IclR family transcriptional regulator